MIPPLVGDVAFVISVRMVAAEPAINLQNLAIIEFAAVCAMLGEEWGDQSVSFGILLLGVRVALMAHYGRFGQNMSKNS